MDCGLVGVNRIKNKRIRLNKLDAWWSNMDRPFRLTVQVKLAQHVFSQHWFDCSSQVSKLNSSSVNTGLIVQVKSACSSHHHLISRVQYRRSTRLNSTRPVQMSCTLVHARPYSKQTSNRRLWITT